MPYEIFLALRYLRSRHKRRLARATAFAAMLGIGMGVAALVVALALSNGFRDEMRQKILEGTAHLSVLRSDGQPIDESTDIKTRILKVDGVVSASFTTYDGALARGTNGTAYSVLRGTENNSGDSAALRSWINKGSMFETTSLNEPQAVVGEELATRLGLKPGEIIEVIPASSGNSTARRLRVTGIFKSGLFEYDSTWIYLPLEVVRAFAETSHSAAIISVQVNNPDQVKLVASRIKATLGDGYNTVDWQQANQPLFSALALERRMGLFIIGLIVAVAVLNITTMLILVVVERRRDIAIMNALGAKRRGVMLVFVIEGAIVGACGAIGGVVVGLIACVVGNHYKIVSLSADVYSITNVPLNARLSETLIAGALAFLMSVVATIYPARSAAKMKPVEMLREAT